MITLEKIKSITIDIKNEAEKKFFNEIHKQIQSPQKVTRVDFESLQAEHKGVCEGLDMLVNHLEELERNK